MTSVAIPNRAVFRSQEVCEIAQVQPYVLRSWEAEFPDLGATKTANGQRVYRRADVERVLRLKHLLFGEGLTLAGARKRLIEESGAPAPSDEVSDDEVVAALDEEMRQGLRDVRRGLQWMLGVLSGGGVGPEDFVLIAEPATRRAKAKKPARAPWGCRAGSGSASARPCERSGKSQPEDGPARRLRIRCRRPRPGPSSSPRPPRRSGRGSRLRGGRKLHYFPSNTPWRSRAPGRSGSNRS